jgi:hypothetical protein
MLNGNDGERARLQLLNTEALGLGAQKALRIAPEGFIAEWEGSGSSAKP